ncbi:MAG: hypothetical protein KFF77_01665, partial [Bacteroidetes bacterium]|nr:hypothetical protein [Bacteroidota bacterium]
ALETLMNRYVCRLQVAESGEVLFDFGSALRRRDSKTLREHLRTAAELLWKVFTVGFKIWITVMLVLYFVIFVILLLVLMFAGKDEKKGIKLGWLGDLFADIFFLSSRNMMIVHAMDGAGYRHRAFRQEKRSGGGAETKKRLVQSVYDFVFGPPRPNYDPFSNEKEVAAWLRTQDGVLTMTELVALAGWTYDQASERMADYLTRFRGEATITDDGVLIGDFHRMLARGDSDIAGGTVELFWEEYEAPYEVTGNSTGRNAAIIGMNAFNLLFAAVILGSPALRDTVEFLLFDYGYDVSMGALFSVLGIVPLAFSLLFFAVPLLRLLPTRRLEAERRKRNARRRVLRHVFDRKGRPASLHEYLVAVRQEGGKGMRDEQVRGILEELLPRYGGRTDLAEDGTVLYIFDRINREEVAAARERATKRLDPGTANALGEVIFDTGTPSV